MRLRAVGLIALIGSGVAVSAATPPAIVNYQGVLRSSSNAPLSGSYDMVFRFFDASVGGNEVMIDAHQAASMNPVVVSGGTFNTQLGAGTITDGSGPGSYTSLADVFRDYAAVWLEIRVGAETLSPRVRVAAAAYALNASNLEGRPAARFLDTSSTSQTKTGSLTAATTAPGATGVSGSGPGAGGSFADADGTSSALAGSGGLGIDAVGLDAGGHFKDQGNTAEAWTCNQGFGIRAFGRGGGGYFKELGGSGEASVAQGNVGAVAQGSVMGGAFADTDDGSQAFAAWGSIGLYGIGVSEGGHFKDGDDSGEAWVGYGDVGIQAVGYDKGGSFGSSLDSGYAYLGYGDEGIFAAGHGAGGHFKDSDGSGESWVGFGDAGIEAHGSTLAGVFRSNSVVADALLAFNSYGVYAYGPLAGGLFFDNDDTGKATIGYGPRGIWAKGSFSGGTFSDTNADFANVFWADVATPTRKIIGTGTVSFVQNHPYEKDKTIAYAAPEGDEVAVYTRGSSRLVGGQARVKLGETFQWVANPDLGLTAHLTPVGGWADLYVASKSTTELVVKSRDPKADDIAFDYIVYGLRVGFEDLPVVQPKQREAFLPESQSIENEYGPAPGLREFSARERFDRNDQSGRLGGARDLSRSRALEAAINEGRSQMITAGKRDAAQERSVLPRPPALSATKANELPGPAAPLPSTVPSSPLPVVRPRPEPDRPAYPALAVNGVTTPGDVVVLDAADPGSLRASSTPSDPAVAGCVVAPEAGHELPRGQALVAVAGIAVCRVDATQGPIHAGDLLTTSATPGHAMRAVTPAAGTILGKAMEPLEAGTGLIRVLVSPR